MTGWAPTQGHIPSGVPYLGFAREGLTSGSLNKVMIVGKGSLFLGRMTSLFDGVSFLVKANSGTTSASAAPTAANEDAVRKVVAEAMRKVADVLTECGDE
jgi:hypothetical protein